LKHISHDTRRFSTTMSSSLIYQQYFDMSTPSLSAAKRIATLNRIRKLSRLMDTAIRIPIINFRIGLDPILGLVPGAGDIVTTAFSAYIIFLARRFQLPSEVMSQMGANIVLEAVVGSVPLLGDLFDAYYKANVRNLALLEKHLQVAEPELEQVDPLNLSSTEMAGTASANISTQP
jgi:hypothetical protein